MPKSGLTINENNEVIPAKKLKVPDFSFIDFKSKKSANNPTASLKLSTGINKKTINNK
jgi:hypothetical protein